MGLFVLLLFLSALDAYDLGPFPLQWVMQLTAIAGVVYLALKWRLPRPLGSSSLWLFCLWSGLITIANALFIDYASLMPYAAATPYSLFILLRLLTLLSFVASLYLIYWLLQQGWRERVVKATIMAGTVISVAAIYIYIAQVYGLPEPPRTRLGTSGGLQAVTFTYDFHRAIGTFREPSLLAAWLIVPFFLCLSVRGRLPYVQGVLIGGTMLLTGSLSGILATAIGLGVATLAALASRANRLASFVRVLFLPLALGIFYLIAVSNTASDVDLFATLANRLGPILLNGGLSQSDRGYIYDYVARNTPPLLGTGLGNANLLLGQYLGTSVIAGFISLYLNSLYATGLIGLALLGYFLLAPVLKVATRSDLRREGAVLLMIAPYLAWLVVLAVAIEEFSFMFALICALLSHEILSHGKIGQIARRA